MTGFGAPSVFQWALIYVLLSSGSTVIGSPMDFTLPEA